MGRVNYADSASGILKVILIILLLVLFQTASSFAETTVGGLIASDTTWTLAGSPYVVESPVQVYGTTTDAVTLTIEPGVEVCFNSGAGLQIGSSVNLGALSAQGTALDPIVFTRNNPTGTWGRVSFQDGTVDETTVLDHVEMEFNTGIYFYTSSPHLQNCRFTEISGTYGLYLSSSSPVLQNVDISTAAIYGMSLYFSSPRITDGSLNNNNASGYGIYGSGSPEISNYHVDIVDTPGKYGLYLTGDGASLSIANSTIGNSLYLTPTNILPTITGNTFTNADNSPIRVAASLVSDLVNNNSITGLSSVGRIEVIGNRISTDVAWPKLAAPYVVVSGTVSVYGDAITTVSLTLEPGVEIRFNTGAGLSVGYNYQKGSLIAQGTPTERITLTRYESSGNFNTIYFYQGTDSTTLLEHVDIDYGKGFYLQNASPTFRNCTITNVDNYYAFYLSGSAPLIEDVDITVDYTYGIFAISSSPAIVSGNLVNTQADGQGLYVSNSPAQISDYNIQIVDVPGKYGIFVTGSSSHIALTNTTVGNGIYFNSTGCMPTITGNTFTHFDNSPLRAGANIIGGLLSDNSFTGMLETSKITVLSETIKDNVTWPKQIAPYELSGSTYIYKDTTSPASLTIEAGAVLEFAASSRLIVGSGNYQGFLNIQGTGTEPVLLTSNQNSPLPGAWNGVQFNGASASASVIDHAIIEYGGTGGDYSNANIYAYNASPSIRNSIIRHSAGSGIYLYNAGNDPQIVNTLLIWLTFTSKKASP